MPLHAAIRHRTSYTYDKPTEVHPQIIRLRPAPHTRTPIIAYSQKISPAEHFMNWQQDPFGNFLSRVVFPERVNHFEVTVDVVADMAVINPFDFFVEDAAEEFPFTYDEGLRKELAPYLETAAHGPLFEAFLAKMPRGGMTTTDLLVEVNRLVEQKVDYLIRMEPGVQKPEETLLKHSGSCRDSSWLLVHLLRRIGIAARFVSGYLIQLTPDVAALDGPSGTDVDFTDLHAWAEAYVPGAGWIGLDPTSGLFAGEGHIPLAATPAPSSAAPISGSHAKAEVTFDFEMEVTRVLETPRVTKPYSESQWSAINRAGKAIDEKLRAGDVRLTMGGEPTFTAIENRDAGEWNTEAVGPTKRAYADDLVRRLRDKFAPGGMLHHGQGKWYPGEQLPRWAFAIYWRKDGEPLWDSDAAIAREEPGTKAAAPEAAEFMAELSDRLGLDDDYAQPVFEDSAEFILKERQLPENLDPANNKLDDPLERQRLARVFDRGLREPSAFILPIQAAQSRAARDEKTSRRRVRWMSEKWRTRRRRLFLVPGDSPAGFRLPLQALRYIDEANYPYTFPPDPFAPQRPLPVRSTLMQRRGAEEGKADDAPSSAKEAGAASKAGLSETSAERADMSEDEFYGSLPPALPGAPDEAAGAGIAPGATFVAGNAVRTALTIEPRDGILYVFMPPTQSAEEYIDLLAAVEETAEDMALPVRVEGYPPPDDARLNVIKVTPDPGVIEVNVHPSATWDEQVQITEMLYEEARLCRLDTTKFMVDGKPVGTGGGNHVVVGGASPPDSPFLRRPDLLASIIRYWQRHPSLSFLFSGQFIGPTSQSPRIDEARDDNLYEMELALSQVPDPFAASGGECPPWLVDRIFRNLLVDSTGNTHRAEICIDKLYSPDGPTGRLGLVEFRAFEMPPHARMSLAQQLVIRALIAWFWERPYTAPLERWGTALHDKFMLPHYVWTDFKSVCEELSDGLGITIDAAWFRPQFEFRFPRYGSITRGPLSIELRSALEPWHVLGEEGVIGGTARYVDSSLERLEARVTGDLSERYAVTCNGYRLPLRPTGRGGDAVTGIRFRAWLPAAALHPTIGIDSPLTFDIVDEWNGKAIGGCVYHVSHPGGRNYDLQPLNSYEAEGRRLARFEAMGHTPGSLNVMSPRMSPEHPHTLDLRLQRRR